MSWLATLGRFAGFCFDLARANTFRMPPPGRTMEEAYRIGVTTFFHAANDAAVAAAIVVHAVSFIPVVLVGIVFMMQDGLSVGRLQALAGTAREKELPDTDEMPVLRPPRR